jgi:modulator of FtsH protease
MAAYVAEPWSDLYVAMAGAAAALLGLLFVAVSINLEQVLRVSWLPLRAGETLGVLVVLLATAVFVLVPGQSPTALGLELAGTGLVLIGADGALRIRRGRPPGAPARSIVVPAVIVACTGVPLVLAGATLVAGDGGGLYWTVPALLAGFAGAVSNAWVLLVEILR